jgi:putative endonuclease
MTAPPIDDPTGTQARRAAERRGRQGELAAALWLTVQGVQIIDRRVRTPFGEIDLVGRQRSPRGDLILIIEVKARPTTEEARQAVRFHQQKRLVRAGNWWAKSVRKLDLPRRHDLVALAPGRWPRWVRGHLLAQDIGLDH